MKNIEEAIGNIDARISVEALTHEISLALGDYFNAELIDERGGVQMNFGNGQKFLLKITPLGHRHPSAKHVCS